MRSVKTCLFGAVVIALSVASVAVVRPDLLARESRADAQHPGAGQPPAGGTPTGNQPPAAGDKPEPAASPVDRFPVFEDRLGYALGFQIAYQLGTFKKQTEFSVDSVVQAIRDSLAETPKMTEKEVRAVMAEYTERLKAKKDEEAKAAQIKGDAFLAANKDKEGVKTTESGLQYKVLVPGTGENAGPTSRVKVHYVGTLLNGTEFDSSVKRGTPYETAVNGSIITGWKEALQLMNTGAKFEVYIPPKLAYAERGKPPIGPNETLIFQLELIEIMK
ncbi:MAG: FKBP-type peptidyl-prolyl cis-trans isomerase [Planctomycetota bacterium]